MMADETTEVQGTEVQAGAPAVVEGGAPDQPQRGGRGGGGRGGSGGATVESAQEVGRRVAERAKAAGVTQVVFDRGGFLFHGRVKALADAAREGGLEF